MYLITVEGGDGSGKGEAARILKEIVSDFPFPAVVMTHEPRRNSPIGLLALESVKKGDKSPLQEAALFAADRLDHTHTWILPRLQSGELVISDRNIHSSLVYQGSVGNLGYRKVALMNAGAAIPDLVIWVDCDPAMAMKRINRGTLRGSSQKSEYFETNELQAKVREGFHELLGKPEKTPAPFDLCTIAGPILNEGSKKQLKKELSAAIRGFLNKRPPPLNVDPQVVDRHHLQRLVEGMATQKRLPGSPIESTSLMEDWLAGKSPASWLEKAEKAWIIAKARESDVASSCIHHSIWSLMGTLSFIPSADVPSLRRHLGPVRAVSQRHTQRLVKWFEKIGWTHRQQIHVPFSDAPTFKIGAEWIGFGRMVLALWPMQAHLAEWRRRCPKEDTSKAMDWILDEDRMPKEAIDKLLEATTARLQMLTSGHLGCPAPTTIAEYKVWWSSLPKG